MFVLGAGTPPGIAATTGGQGMVARVGGGPFGTVTLTDVGNSVQFTADVNTGFLPKVVSLNYFNPSQTTGWSVSGGGALTVSFNNAGYYGLFDIRNADASPFANPFTFTLSNSAVDLDPMNFVVKDKSGLYFTVVATTGPSGTVEGNFYGSTTTVPDGGATLMLLGGALMGIGALRRKFRV